MTPEEVRELWATTLETADIPQTTGQLARGDGRCCLGVLCDLAVQHGIISGYTPDDGSPPMAAAEWVGLASRSGFYGTRSLTDDNDSGETFPEIAETIRQRPEGLFIVTDSNDRYH